MSGSSQRSEAAARRRAYEALARREHSRREITRKLAGAGFPEEIVAPVLDALVAEGALSDRRFAESLLRRRSGAGYGPLRVLRDLDERGVDRALAEAVVEAGDPAWGERAGDVRARRFRAVPDNPREVARQMRFLQYRGFTGEQARAALRAAGHDGDSGTT